MHYSVVVGIILFFTLNLVGEQFAGTFRKCVVVGNVANAVNKIMAMIFVFFHNIKA